MRTNNVKALVEAGAMSSIAVITGLVSAFVPLIYPFIPLPITLLGLRQGVKWSTMASFVTGVIIMMLTDPIRGLKVMTFCLIGIALGQALRRELSPGRTLFWGSIAAAIALAAYAALTALLLGINPLAVNTAPLEHAFQLSLNFYRGLGINDGQLADIQALGQTTIEMSKAVVLTSFVLLSVAIAAVNFFAARLVLKRLGRVIPAFPPFKLWRLPRYVLFVVIIGTALSYLGQNRHIEWLHNLGIDLQSLGFLLVFAQGLAVFYYLADKYNLSRLTRGIILLMIFVNNIFSFVVAYAGAFDLALDYRRLRNHHSS